MPTKEDATTSRRRRMPRRRSSSAARRSSVVIVVAAALTTTALLLGSFTTPYSNGLLDGRFDAFLADAKEIVATREWQLLSENDTIPAGLHVRMDLSTGEKWVKLPSEEERDDDIRAAVHDGEENGGDDNGKEDGEGRVKVESAVMDASGALSIVEDPDSPKEDATAHDTGTNENAEKGDDNGETIRPQRDYEMMHRVMSNLPPEELERFGGLPDLPALPSVNHSTPSSTPTMSQLTPEQRKLFEGRMEELWNRRQEELARAQESVADLPSILRDRIETIRGYIEDVDGGLEEILKERKSADQNDEGEEVGEEETAIANNVVEALRDLEFQLADVDMARDFHTLGGWPQLVSLLDDDVHSPVEEGDEAKAMLVDEVRAIAAMTIGTAVGNLGEFRGWALEDVSSSSASTSGSNAKTALSLLVSSFERELASRTEGMAGGSMAVATVSNSRYKSRATYKLRAVYALGSLLRGNPEAQRHFVSIGGPEALVSDVLGTLSNVRGLASEDVSVARLDYKFASKVLALGEDVVTDVVLHEDDYVVGSSSEREDILTASRIVGAFTTEKWCDLSLRMLSAPSDTLGPTTSRNVKERAVGAARSLGPGCKASVGDEEWGLEEVRRVRSEWNREGSDDGLDPVYRRELLELADGAIDALR